MGRFSRDRAAKPPEAQDVRAPKAGPGDFLGRTISLVEAQGTVRLATGRRVNVFVEGKFAFAMDGDLAFKLGLRAGQCLTSELVESIQAEGGLTLAVRSALAYAKHRPRSTQETRKRLEDEGFSPQVVEAALEKLSGAGILDDARLAAQWVRHRERLKPKGSGLLKRELSAMGIAAEEVQAVLPDQDREVENAVQALAPWVRRHGVPADRASESKAIAHLQRRGFAFGTARAALNRLAEGED